MVATYHFTFDLTGALAEQLEATLPKLTPVPLATAHIQDVSAFPGIYQLYHNKKLVYIGKADHSLQDRLSDHYRKITGRERISVTDMTFTGLYLEGTWIPVGPEQMLINRQEKKHGAKPPWNVNGFGIKDPGKERDTTTFKETHFDQLYPADLQYILSGVGKGTHQVNKLLPIVKRELPYVFRYQDRWAKHPDYINTHASITTRNPTATDVFNALANALPPGWQITALPGYVIMYKKTQSFPSARRTFIS